MNIFPFTDSCKIYDMQYKDGHALPYFDRIPHYSPIKGYLCLRLITKRKIQPKRANGRAMPIINPAETPPPPSLDGVGIWLGIWLWDGLSDPTREGLLDGAWDGC